MLSEISEAPNCEIVDHNDIMAVAEQAIDQMTSDETGAAGYDAFHDRTHPSRNCGRTGLAKPSYYHRGLSAPGRFGKHYQSVPPDPGRNLYGLKGTACESGPKS